MPTDGDARKPHTVRLSSFTIWIKMHCALGQKVVSQYYIDSDFNRVWFWFRSTSFTALKQNGASRLRRRNPV